MEQQIFTRDEVSELVSLCSKAVLLGRISTISRKDKAKDEYVKEAIEVWDKLRNYGLDETILICRQIAEDYKATPLFEAHLRNLRINLVILSPGPYSKK